MVQIALVCAGLLVAQAGGQPASAHDLKAYEALKAKAGKDPQAQVKLALWCEAHGLNSERLKHLAHAVLADASAVGGRSLRFAARHRDPRRRPPDPSACAAAPRRPGARSPRPRPAVSMTLSS